MLLNQLDQYGVKKHFKVVNVEKILSKGLKLPESVTAVSYTHLTLPTNREV